MHNFGRIKNTFNDLLAEGIIKKDDQSKKLFKKYIRTIRESEILKTQFLIYNNIENKCDDDFSSATIFVSENIKLMEKYPKSAILNENKKLIDLIKDDNWNGVYGLSDLHESINNLILSKKSAKNIDKITENIKSVAKFIVSNQPMVIHEDVDLPISVLTNVMVNKYNSKYSDINESDKEILKKIIHSNMDEKKSLYADVVNECIVMVDSLINDIDDESKDKLLLVKSKLKEDIELTDDNFITNISRLIELKNNLN
jgi:hypothetical protein